ncbi:aspartate kinase [Alicyclobacillus cycloheptanicus]|uniref:Aspartokinase n=1 Tax=Alicyclobacillus cycloheptanicus TaxID=1457 RepID=A0ABT9XG59_9BACL|nr:aspartate kinase [Alicyclobacillus cycloheptanicus]MDQ0189281.1 aspartate kinase [Alicyclobacillus cycloheptanicus]WDM01354.1 aspartate kinase [Alicyclobacillus cycloheptanicus]
MKILVQKFGGTSVATRETRLKAVEHIEDALAKDFHVVVVVSAMGRRGDPYATDTLLNVVDASDPVAPRDLDILMSCGEAISAVVFASQLRSRGHQVTVLSGGQAGIRTNAQHGNARILEIRPKRILDALQEGHIVVVMGFQGESPEGDITTLGRGGSDTTATALGVALNAEYVDIFTDVEGIMTADPRIVEDARMIHRVTYTEICNLAYQGAKVIHPRAVEIAMQKNIPIRVRSTQSKDEGTLVTNAWTVLESSVLQDRYVTGVTQTANITQIQVEGEGVGRLNIFDLMAEHGISVDFISVSPDRIAYTVADADADRAVSLLREQGLEPRIRPDCAKVSVVGTYTGMPGIMARIVEALSSEGISILQSADSHNTIWCLVRRSEMEAAVRALHSKFGLGEANRD